MPIISLAGSNNRDRSSLPGPRCFYWVAGVIGGAFGRQVRRFTRGQPASPYEKEKSFHWRRCNSAGVKTPPAGLILTQSPAEI